MSSHLRESANGFKFVWFCLVTGHIFRSGFFKWQWRFREQHTQHFDVVTAASANK